jgi:hypothetical protein
MKNVIAAALMSIAFTLSPLCAQEKKGRADERSNGGNVHAR